MTFRETLDQAPVLLKHWLIDLLPEPVQWLASILVSGVAILAVFATLFALAVLLERKGLGRIQNRLGPNRVGPWGILQPVADGIKMLIKEDVVPRDADKVLHFLAPVVLVAPATLNTGERSVVLPPSTSASPTGPPTVPLPVTKQRLAGSGV